MNSGKNISLQVKEFQQKARRVLKLRPALGKIGFSRETSIFPSRKGSLSVRVWGKKEIQDFKRLSSKERRKSLEKKLKNDISCIMLADGVSFLPEIEEVARKKRIALFFSGLSRKQCREETKRFFSNLCSDQITISGGLLQIFGLGVLIIGDSGIGKSECALELISRGHRFISDDVVNIMRLAEGKLIGTSSSLARYFMEIRGLGIINIKKIFGVRAICRQSELDLVISLKKWLQGKEYDRLGLKFPEDYKLLGEKIPRINIPVGPGRNMATLIEVACKVYILRQKGYLAAQEITRKLERALSLPCDKKRKIN